MSDENEDLQRLDQMPPFWRNPLTKKRLSKQLSMCEIPRNIAWEKRRRQFLQQERRKNGINQEADHLTDEDMNELKGCIELGFGFSQEDGQRLSTTIPALDLFLAVNRQVYPSPISSPASTASAPSLGASSVAVALGDRSSSFGSDSDSWKICSPGDDPQHVKTKLRHWAQAVACSLRQSS
ncbi:hypothetical protein BUALT_Bualt19G0056700 [Buddleja alternifolia]|uniref:Uncharacterized protein n=1 Tax=Buddleja alternifolia TaxID=168488 RepID=A0AAV6W261_9LAMI|nr:hypothetical protein BUALT_Bualt19G0056700 [Buddleja alternifolia]